jgi:hypothetical protein
MLAMVLLAACHPSPRPTTRSEAMVITRESELDGAVGRTVRLSGTVANSRIATLVGVDVASEAPDLRGQPAVASGRLEREVVMQEAIDREIAAHGQFAHRGPGTYYRLIDPHTGQLAQVRPPRGSPAP